MKDTPSPASITSPHSRLKIFDQFNTRTKIILGFSVPLSLLAIISTVVYLSLGQLIETSTWVKHTQKVIADGKELEKLMIDMETGERGFLITGKDSFLEPFNQAKAVFDTKRQQLQKLVNDNPEQVERLETVGKLKNQWITEAADVEISKRRSVKRENISLDYMQNVLRKGHGKNILDDLRTTIDELDRHFKQTNNQVGQNILLKIAKDLVDQASGQRGFLITGEDIFLEPYHAGRKNLSLHMSQLRQFIDNNYDSGSVAEQISQLEQDAESWLLSAAEPEIKLRQQVTLGTRQLEDIQGTLIQARGKGILDRMRVDIHDLDKTFSKAGDQQAKNILAQIAKSLVDRETGQRGFLITGKSEFLQPFENAKTGLQAEFDALKTQVDHNFPPAQVLPLVEKIQDLSSLWLHEAAMPEIAARRKINQTGLGKLEFIEKILSRDLGKNILDAIRINLDSLSAVFIDKNDVRGENYLLKLAKSIVDQETGERGFLLTGDDAYLAPFHQGNKDFDNTILDLMLYVRTDTRYSHQDGISRNISAIRALHARWNTQAAKPEIEARRKIDRQDNNSLAYIQKTLTRARGKDILDEIRQLTYVLHEQFKDSNIQATGYLLTISKAIIDQETGQRGFLITGEDPFLAPYFSGKASLRETFPKLKNIVRDSYQIADTLANIDAIEGLTAQWLMQAARPEIALRNQMNDAEANFEQIQAVLSQGLGKGIQDKIHFSLQTLKSSFNLAKNDQAYYLTLLLEKDIVDRETGQRGYLVTGRTEFLQPFEDGQKSLERHLDELTKLVESGFDKHHVLSLIETLRLKTIEWEEVAAAPEIAIRRALNDTGAKMSDITALIETETGKKIIDEIRAILSQFVLTENSLMLIQEREAEDAASMTILIVVIGSIVAIILALITSLLVSKSIVSKLATLVEATEKVSRGDYEQQIRLHSEDEFGQLAQSFNNMTLKLKYNTEEMNEQNQRLIASEEEMKEQSEELKASNEELEEKQQELRSSNEELASQQQALELQSAKLLKSKNQIEQKANQLELTSKYKSEFLANMSHELRTPLNSLLILSKSLYQNKPGNLTEEQVEDAHIVYQGGQTLLTLINDIMDLSKVEAGMLDINLDSFLPGDVQYNLETLFNPLALEKNLAFSINVDNRLSSQIKNDKHRLEQILKNFLSNAFKFTQKGQITLDIHPQAEDQELLFSSGLVDTNVICFSVTDSGIGIPADKQQDIFEAFQQADGSTSRQYGGTGLGLTISKELARLLGGKITMTSEPGKGSCFTLILPVNAPSKQASRPQAINLADNSAKTDQAKIQANTHMASNTNWLDDDRFNISTGDEALLLIEDDQAFSQILIDLIHSLNLKVIATDKGRDGVMLAMEYLPKGILLDLGLPDISGLHVLEQLKHNLQTRHIPVHVISASDNKMESLHLGALSYLKKPVDPKMITSTLQEVYAGSQLSNKRILVIEDDKGTQHAINSLLDGPSTELSYASTAKEACEQLRDNDFNCIILDLNLPDMSGTELVKLISEQPGAGIDVPIIIYTGQTITQDEYRILNQFTPSIVIKGAESPERLLDDVALFLHRVGDNFSNKQQQTLQMLHDENQMLVGRRVLVVDDDMRNVFSITRILEQAGIKVLQAENGQLAIDLLTTAEQPIELILMDIMMPVMDGYQAIEHIRKMAAYRTTPIIALTAKAMPGDRHQSIEAGASEYLTKPLDMDKVLSMLRVWLYRRTDTTQTVRRSENT